MSHEIAAAVSMQTACELSIIPCMVLLKYLTFVYAKNNQFGYRLILGAAEILSLCVMSVLLMISVEQYLPGAGSRVSAMFAIGCTALLAIVVHCMNLMGEKKRRLTEQQKAELMDL